MGPTHTPTQHDEAIDTAIACMAQPLRGVQVIVPADAGDLDLTVSGERPASRGRRLAERGMVTAEYAVGILAAVAFALVLLKVFHDNSVFTAMLRYVTSLIGQLSSQIK